METKSCSFQILNFLRSVGGGEAKNFLPLPPKKISHFPAPWVQNTPACQPPGSASWPTHYRWFNSFTAAATSAPMRIQVLTRHFTYSRRIWGYITEKIFLMFDIKNIRFVIRIEGRMGILGQGHWWFLGQGGGAVLEILWSNLVPPVQNRYKVFRTHLCFKWPPRVIINDVISVLMLDNF